MPFPKLSAAFLRLVTKVLFWILISLGFHDESEPRVLTVIPAACDGYLAFAHFFRFKRVYAAVLIRFQYRDPGPVSLANCPFSA